MIGWIKLHRALLDSQAFANEGLLKVWIYCLLRANHENQWVSINTGRGITEIKVKPGQFIFGRKEAAKDLRMKPSSVRNRMVKLKNMRNLDMQPDTHFSIVTICNWHTYQNIENTNGQASGQPKDNQRTTKGQPKDTDKNDKNDKNDKKVGRFSPPEVQNVREYMSERNGDVSQAERFIDFYESNGWKVGKNKMKNWQAAVRNWLSRNAPKTEVPAGFPK